MAAKKKSAKKPVKKAAPKKAASKKTAKPLQRVVTTKRATALNMNAPITPLEDRLIVAVTGESDTTAGGIIIPGTVEARPWRGTVLAKGRGRRNKKGGVRPLDVNIGDEVLFSEYAGTKITMGGDEVLILREEDILGIVT